LERIETDVIPENKPAYKVTRNNRNLVHRYTTFIVANQIAATCFGCTKQPSSGCMCEEM